MGIQKINVRFSLLVVIILVAAFSRIIPHMPNFSPLGAIGLFSAAYFTRKWHAFLIVLVATWLSDLFINNVIYAQYNPEFTWFYNGFYWQYGSYIVITFIALFIFNKINLQRIVLGALMSTVVFFLISNFGVWATGTMYPKTSEGLLTCYAAGIPFMKGTLLGNFVYSGLLFGTFALLKKRIPSLQQSTTL